MLENYFNLLNFNEGQLFVNTSNTMTFREILFLVSEKHFNGL
jgi:hypothetical protein